MTTPTATATKAASESGAVAAGIAHNRAALGNPEGGTARRDENWLYLTEAPTEDLHRFHRDETLSVVHYAASVADRTAPQAAIGVLKAMGKDENVTGMRMHPSDSVNALPVWVTAHQTKVILLSRAQSWSSNHILTELLRLLAATPTVVVVAIDPGVPNGVSNALRGFSPTTIPSTDIANLLPGPDTFSANQHTPPPAARIDVPVADWPTYRYECRATLPAEDFSRLDATYVAAFSRARRAVTEVAPTNDSTRDLIVNILRSSDDAADATTAFRATQAAYFTAGYNLRLDPTRLISLYAHTRPPTFTARDWMALRAYKDPARSAACTLYAHGLTVAEIAAYTVGDAETDLSAGTVNGKPLHPHATVFLEANLIHRGIHGAASDQPFIPLASVARVLNDAGKDVGILTAGKPVHTSLHTKAIWTAGSGFLLKPIDHSPFASAKP